VSLCLPFDLKPEEYPLSPQWLSQTKGSRQTLPAMASSSIFDCDMDALNQDIPNFDDPKAEDSCQTQDEDEGSVNVEKVLLETLSAEVKELLATIKNKDEWLKLRGHRDTLVCPLCPCRQFRDLKKQGKGRLLDHLLVHHSGKEVATATGKDFVASGSKQYMLIRALYDQQAQAQTKPTGLLRQSASLMRSWLEQCSVPGADRENLLDRKLVLCLTGEGPKYLGAEMVQDSGLYRTVGYVWYDRDFARIFFGEMIRANGKAKAIATNLIHHFLSTGCQVVFLLPRKATTVYLKLMEDIMASPVVTAWKEKLVAQCLEQREWVHLSMDATVRMAMRIKGQANYRETKEQRAQYLVGDSEAKRRILTIRGRTGGVLVMNPVLSEASEHIKDLLFAEVPGSVRLQVEFVASDQPSAALYDHLKLVCPSLRAVYLDEVHLCIVWNLAFWRKSSPGQKVLRRVQAKFNRVDMDTPVEHWGSLYTGHEEVVYSAAEEDMRNLIMSGGMSPQRAASVLNHLEDEKPWYCRLDYIRALAAIAAAFPQEMARKTYVLGRSVGHILWCAAAPEKVSWLFNALIVRRSLPKTWMTLLPSGTTSNESLHAELNRWWRNSPEQFPTTLELHLRVGHLGKLLAHNSALYSPTLRQVPHDQVLALAVRGVSFGEQGWRSWCEAGVRAEVPMFSEREELGARLAEQPKAAKTQDFFKVMKKPAAASSKKKPAAASVEVTKVKVAKVQIKKVRRTAFSLKRIAL